MRLMYVYYNCALVRMRVQYDYGRTGAQNSEPRGVCYRTGTARALGN